MNKPALTLASVAVVGVLAGWLGGNLELPAEAQRDVRRERTDPNGREPVPGLTRNPAVSRLVETTEVYPTIDCVFTIIDIGADRGDILLDECTGNTWWYDNGWQSGSGYSGSYVREPAWHLISREGEE